MSQDAASGAAQAAVARLNASERDALSQVAWSAIVDGLAGRSPEVALAALPAPLRARGASFVTLERPRGRLRGCIGSLSAFQPLARDVAGHAWNAAFADPRFEPLTTAELDGLCVHLSVLSTPTPFPVRDEEDALTRLVPGVHGVVLSAGRRRATFLPSVWESLPDPAAFLASLKNKAGLPPDHWPVELEVYTVQEWDAAPWGPVS